MKEKYWKCLICKEVVEENEPCKCMRDVKFIAKMYEDAI